LILDEMEHYVKTMLATSKAEAWLDIYPESITIKAV